MRARGSQRVRFLTSRAAGALNLLTKGWVCLYTLSKITYLNPGVNQFCQTAVNYFIRLLKSVKENEKLDFYHDTARFISDGRMKIGTDTLTADKIFIGTGSKPFIPDIP